MTSTPRVPSSVRSKIYQTLYSTQEFCSKQMLAARCGISMPTLYQNLNELMTEGLVQYSGEERSTGGRRAQGLEIIPDAKLAVGIAVGGSRLRFVVTDLRLQELAYKSVPFDFVSSVQAEDSSLAESLETFFDEFQVDRAKLLGVGITIPGLITQDHSRIHAAPTLGLKDVPLELLTRGIPYPVYVENDASASGHAECFVRGGYSNLAYYSLEYGIGGAVVIGGIPYAGDNAASSPAVCAAAAGGTDAWSPTVPPDGLRKPSVSRWKNSSRGSKNTTRTMRRCCMICFGTSPSPSTAFIWFWTVMSLSAVSSQSIFNHIFAFSGTMSVQEIPLQTVPTLSS